MEPLTIKLTIMKKFTLPVFIAVCYFALISFETTKSIIENYDAKDLLFTGGAPASKTGAPGETTCTSCHAGSTNDGTSTSSISFSGANNEYETGQTYNMSLSISNGSAKNGFQIVALDDNNSNAGTLVVTDPANTTSVSGSGNTYINQSSSGTAQTSWSFDWTAPSSNVGNVTFYYAYNVTNSNGANSGDQIYVAQQVIEPFNSTTDVLTPYALFKESYKVYYNEINASLTLSFTNNYHSNQAFVKLVNMEGKTISTEQFNIQNGINEIDFKVGSELPKGIYLVSLFLDNNVATNKIMIN